MTKIEKADPGDLPELLSIFEQAKLFMRRTGNPDQWNDDYPTREVILSDILAGELYKVTEDGTAHAVFMASDRGDAWYDENPESFSGGEGYWVIHRVASDGKIKGVLALALDFVRPMAKAIRMDTYIDNHVMQHALLRNGMVETGRLSSPDGRVYLAFSDGTLPAD